MKPGRKCFFLFFFFYSSCNAVQRASVNGLGKLQQREGEAVRGAQDQKLNRRKGGERERWNSFFFFYQAKNL